MNNSSTPSSAQHGNSNPTPIALSRVLSLPMSGPNSPAAPLNLTTSSSGGSTATAAASASTVLHPYAQKQVQSQQQPQPQQQQILPPPRDIKTPPSTNNGVTTTSTRVSSKAAHNVPAPTPPSIIALAGLLSNTTRRQNCSPAANAIRSRRVDDGADATAVDSSSTPQFIDPAHPALHRDLLMCIVQYLETQGLASSSAALKDELSLKSSTRATQRETLRRLKKFIVQGEYANAEKLLMAGMQQAPNANQPPPTTATTNANPTAANPSAKPTPVPSASGTSSTETSPSAATGSSTSSSSSSSSSSGTTVPPPPVAPPLTRKPVPLFASARTCNVVLFYLLRQQMLECLERQQIQKALTLLTHRLKPVETWIRGILKDTINSGNKPKLAMNMTQPPASSYEHHTQLQYILNEFKLLAYLLTCKSLTQEIVGGDGEQWVNVAVGRERLAERIEAMCELELTINGAQWEQLSTSPAADSTSSSSSITSTVNFSTLPPDRLLTLMNQAVSHQIAMNSNYQPRQVHTVDSLLHDYSPFTLPNAPLAIYRPRKKSSMKCIDFVGQSGRFIVAGASDHSLTIYDTRVAAQVSAPSSNSSSNVPSRPSSVPPFSTTSSGSSGNNIPQAAVTALQKPIRTLHHHSSHIWCVRSSVRGDIIASASNEAKLWFLSSREQEWMSRDSLKIGVEEEDEEVSELNEDFLSQQSLDAPKIVSLHGGHEYESHLGLMRSDIYSITLNSSSDRVVTGGYDKKVCLWNVENAKLLRTFTHHTGSVTAVAFHPHSPNLVITGSKDRTIRLLDTLSGNCVHTITSSLGEVTSVELNNAGTMLLTSAKDNTNRLFDLRFLSSSNSSASTSSSTVSRSTPCVQRFKGHSNITTNFISSCFGAQEKVIIGGSQDGLVYEWDAVTGQILNRLNGHQGTVFQTRWNSQQSVLASCGDDGTVRSWQFDPALPFFASNITV